MHLVLHFHASTHVPTCIRTCTHEHTHAQSLIFIHCVYVLQICMFKHVVKSQLCSVLSQFNFVLNYLESNQVLCSSFGVCAHVPFLLCETMQMPPTKHATKKKSSSKRARTSSKHFKLAEADIKFNDCYKHRTIIMERVVQMESLEGTFIPDISKERTQTKLLTPSGVVYSEIIREFFSNATVEDDHINCWVRRNEFVIMKDNIQDFLEIRPPSQPITTQYEDKLGSIAKMVRALDGTMTKNAMNTIPFSPEMRTLAYVMIHNLYPVTNLTTLSAPRTFFLYDLFTHKEIDICGHIFHLLKKGISKQNSTLIMGLIAKERLKLPSGLTVVQRDYLIGAHTLSRSIAHIRGSRIGVHIILQPHVEQDKDEDTEEEIDRFTSIRETSAQPSSSTPTQGLSKLDQLMAKMDQMSIVLDSHVQHAVNQFAYLQGQITALSSQIQDLSSAHGSDFEPNQFQHFWPFRSKRGRKF